MISATSLIGRRGKMPLSRIEKLVAELTGDETARRGNIFFIGRDCQARLLEYVVEMIRPALPLMVFRPLVELSIDNLQGSTAPAAHRQGEWHLQCLVLGPQFLTDASLDVRKERQSSLGADLVLGEDGNLHVLEWSDTWVRTPEGSITYQASTRRYESFKDAFDEGWGPVDHYVEQIEERLETAAQLHPSLPQSTAKS